MGDRRASKKTGIVICSTLFAFVIIAVSIGSYLVLAADAVDDDYTNIRQVHLISRHGAKMPDAGLLFGIEPETPPELPFGSLSLKGMQQQFQLGTLMRKRYRHLMPSNGLWSRELISIKASISDRAIASALSFLASFMPPSKQFQPFVDLAWQPVPLVTIPRELDTLIIQRVECPRYDVEMKRELQSESIRKYEQDNSELYKFVAENSGVNVTSFAQIDQLHNSLNAMESAGWRLPVWAQEVYPKNTSKICLRYLKFLSESKFMKKARGGSLLTEIANTMQNSSLTVSVYAGHDVTLVNLISVLNLADQMTEDPKYASTVVVELLDQGDDEKHVRILHFINEHDENPREFAMPDCARPCKLSRFVEAYREYLVADYDEMCRVDGGE